MAKKPETKPLDIKSLNKLLGNYMPKAPVTMLDGSLKTARWLTGITALDLLLNGGLPQGHTIAIGAEPGIGKTTIFLQALANIVEKYDKKVYYLDAERGATYELIEAMGIAPLLWHPVTNPSGKFYLLEITTIQELATILKRITEDDETAVIVLDSDTEVINGMALEEDDLGTSNNAVASDARMWSAHGKKLQAVVKRSNACFVLVHQARVDLTGFRPRITASGGNAAKHMASVEIWGKRKEWITEDFAKVNSKKDSDGALLVLTTSKNRLTKPFATIELPIIFGRGISNKYSYRVWLEEYRVIIESTGEATTALSMRGGGYYTLRLPSGIYEVHGGKEVWKLIDLHYDEIVKYVDDNGGFLLEAEDIE